MSEYLTAWLRILAIPAAVQLLFLCARITDVVTWPWWAICAPAWGTALILLAGSALLFIALGTWGRS